MISKEMCVYISDVVSRNVVSTLERGDVSHCMLNLLVILFP